MVPAPTRTLTLESFLQWPDTKPASEYIDGQVTQKTMPKAGHSVIQGDLTTAINLILKADHSGRALPELRCTFENRSIVPDVAVLPSSIIPRREDGKVTGELLAPPDWMIEILSPGQSQTKVVKKILHAIDHGTQVGWLIDPDEECVFGYTPDWRSVLYDAPDAVLPVPAFAKAFQLTVGELVAWLYA